eukprot:CAMPEP_0118868244 /NCGR_PEP_ID=MMETSP1163-20130328/11710_1 /TAXON_ID=124430 /ORGANISM="Phaeomonas parva, Strain CCMP2877" /LENGTH=343 /DNA_ID=CAMNT_0006802867 /DNA_START=156 /DNA_END=1183 /DNA_ORIENTATION=+
MSTKYAVSSTAPRTLLALNIVRVEFGPIVEQVAQALAMHGRCTLRELIKIFDRNDKVGVGAMASFRADSSEKLHTKLIASALISLLQHRMLEVTCPSEEEWASTRSLVTEDQAYFYVFRPDWAVLRLRFGRYVLHVKRIIGEVAAAVLKEVIKEGRTLKSRAVDRAVDVLHKAQVQRREEVEEARREAEEAEADAGGGEDGEGAAMDEDVKRPLEPLPEVETKDALQAQALEAFEALAAKQFICAAPGLPTRPSPNPEGNFHTMPSDARRLNAKNAALELLKQPGGSGNAPPIAQTSALSVSKSAFRGKTNTSLSAGVISERKRKSGSIYGNNSVAEEAAISA